MKKNEVLKPTDQTKSKVSRHLLTFVAGANIVLGTFVLPQLTHAAVTKQENLLTKKAAYVATAYEKFGDTSLEDKGSVNGVGCNGSGCNQGCN